MNSLSLEKSLKMALRQIAVDAIIALAVVKESFLIGMWPSGKAPDSESGNHRFESYHPSLAFNEKV